MPSADDPASSPLLHRLFVFFLFYCLRRSFGRSLGSIFGTTDGYVRNCVEDAELLRYLRRP